MPDLCTLAYVKGILPTGATTNPGPNDSVYSLLISAASAAFLKACNRATILAQSFTETYSGDGSDSLILRNSPILSVTSLAVGSLSIPAYASPQSSGFVIADNGFEILLNMERFSTGFRNIKVTYEAGYQTVPLDVQQAVAEMVLWKKAKMPRIDLSTQTLNGQEVLSYSQNELQGVKNTILRYDQKLSASAFRR